MRTNCEILRARVSLKDTPISDELLTNVRCLGEFPGRWVLYPEQSP
jgi:hypothetical protein